MINLYYNYYVSQSLERNNEIEYCLKRLYENSYIDNYFIFMNEKDVRSFKSIFNFDKSTEIFIISRPKYKDFFDVSDIYSSPNDINIIINSDCFIDEYDTKKLLSMNSDDFYALSRLNIVNLEKWNLSEEHILAGSQDCWIYKGKIRKFKSDFYLGYAGCDNVIAYQIKKAGYNLINCPYDIRIYHYHLSKIDRNYLWNLNNYRHFNFYFIDVIKNGKVIQKGHEVINEKIKKSAYFFWNKGTKFSFLRYLTLFSFRLNHPDWEMTLYLANADNKNYWDSYEQQDFIKNQSKEDFLNKLKELNVNIKPVNEYSHLNPVHISDIFRWDMLVNNEGGWYFDTDQVFLKSFDDLCTYDFVYGSESYFGIGVLGFSKTSKIPSYFQNLVHQKVNDKLNDYTMIGNTLFATTILRDEQFKVIYNKEKVFKTPDDYFYPIFDSKKTHLIYNGEFDFLDQKRSYAVHWYGGHPISQEFNKNYTSKNYKEGKDNISKYLRDVGIDFDRDILYNINRLESFKNNKSKPFRDNEFELNIYQSNTFNDYLDEVYVINLERRKDRLEHITREMNRYGIRFTRFNAIDGKVEGVSGEIGCLRSHIEVIKNAVKKEHNVISVFEDDIILCDDFLERFNYYISNVPDDWEVLYLGCGYLYGSPKFLVKPYIYKIKQCYGCFAMILNNRNGLFQKIIETAKPEQKAIDNYMAEDILPNLNTYVFEPFFVKTLNTVSDISGREESYSYSGIDNSFKEVVEIPKFNKITKMNPIIPTQINIPVTKTNKEICEKYMKSGDFKIFVANKSIFDSKVSGKSNVQFFDDYFTLFGKKFTYNGMVIKSI